MLSSFRQKGRTDKEEKELFEEKFREYSELANELESAQFQHFKAKVENILAKTYLYYDRAETFEDFLKVKAEQKVLKRLLGIERIGRDYLKRITAYLEQQSEVNKTKKEGEEK